MEVKSQGDGVVVAEGLVVWSELDKFGAGAEAGAAWMAEEVVDGEGLGSAASSMAGEGEVIGDEIRSIEHML